MLVCYRGAGDEPSNPSLGASVIVSITMQLGDVGLRNMHTYNKQIKLIYKDKHCLMFIEKLLNMVFLLGF